MREPERLLTGDEEILDRFRPHWKVLLPALGWAMLLAAALGVMLAAVGDASWRWAAAVVAIVLWLLLATRSVITWWGTTYLLTTERIIVRTGLLARSGTEIPLESIVNVLFSQRVIERLLGYGDILIESAGSQGQSRLEDVPDPEAFQSEVHAAREARAMVLSGPHEPTSARDLVAQLEALADLRERGHLTDVEFEQGKARLLAGDEESSDLDPPGWALRPER